MFDEVSGWGFRTTYLYPASSQHGGRRIVDLQNSRSDRAHSAFGFQISIASQSLDLFGGGESSLIQFYTSALIRTESTRSQWESMGISPTTERYFKLALCTQEVISPTQDDQFREFLEKVVSPRLREFQSHYTAVLVCVVHKSSASSRRVQWCTHRKISTKGTKERVRH
jgi:hypothetical protein